MGNLRLCRGSSYLIPRSIDKARFLFYYCHHLSAPITKTIQVRRTRHAGHYWKSRDELISDVLLWIPTYGRAKAGRPARTFSSYVRIMDVALKTCQRRWTIERSGERGSGISVLAARHDDDDDIIQMIYTPIRSYTPLKPYPDYYPPTCEL